MFESDFRWLVRLQKALNAPSVGGFIGQFLNTHVLHYVGKVGATIVLGAVYLISLIYLTNFKLGQWCRESWAGWFGGKTPAKTAGENDLERRARELEKQARKLQEQLDKSTKSTVPKVLEPTGLGADMKPVPEPTVRDMSFSQAKPGERAKKSPVEPAKEPAPADEGIVIPAKEVAAATTADILGTPAEVKAEPAVAAEKPEEPGEPAPAGKGRPRRSLPSPRLSRASPSRSPSRPRPKLEITQLPPLDFLQYPDITAKPTESKEELMANARLMQQTLAQFDIEVSLGDITKGPTITRYELHPAPGVKLEKIVSLSNNIAAALKAERINILAPVPGKSSVGVEVPNAVKTKVIMRDLFESDEWRSTKARIPLRLGQGRLWPAHRGRPGRDAALAHRRQHRLGQIGLHQRHHRLAALPVSAGPIALRHDRSQGGRIAAIQRLAASGRAGGDRSKKSHSGVALGCQ